MKSFGCVLVLSLVVLFSCQKDKKDIEPEYTVNEFVQLVIEGQYDSWSLPKLSPGDIPIILEYANDFQEIPIFPRNPLSSYLPPKLRLGECLLWTIEHIKKNYNTGHSFYPSSNPILIKNGYGNDPTSGMLNEQELLEVYGLYSNWWYSNEAIAFEEFRYINVLENYGYNWY